MCLLTTEGVVRRSAAALVKLRRSATRTKVLNLFKSRNAAVSEISRLLPASRGGVVMASSSGVVRDAAEANNLLNHFAFSAHSADAAEAREQLLFRQACYRISAPE